MESRSDEMKQHMKQQRYDVVIVVAGWLAQRR